jgi:anti-sigma factor RsiW
MSLSAGEQDALDSIKNGLADSDPALAARLAMFTRLASGEAMPVREKLQAASQRLARRGPARRGPAPRTGWMYQRLGLGRVMLLVWLVATAALIAAVLVSSRVGGHLSCTGTWGTLCARASSAPQPVP